LLLFSLLRGLFVCKSYQNTCSFDILTHVYSDRLRNTSFFSLFSVVIEAEFLLQFVEFSQIRRTFVQHWPFGLCTASFRDYRFVPDRSFIQHCGPARFLCKSTSRFHCRKGFENAVFCTKDSRSFLQEIRDSCNFACARLSVFSPTTFEIWSERERYDRHSFAMACSAPSIGLLLSPSIGVGGRTLPSSSSSESTSAFTPSSQQQNYNISSCFLTTSNKLRLSTVEGFQQVWILETPPYMSETWKPKLLLCFEDSLVQTRGIGLFDSLNHLEQEIDQSTQVSRKKEVICMEHGKYKRM
jgi:hypothetical protein